MPDRMNEQELNQLINMLELSENVDEEALDASFAEPDLDNDLGGRVLVRAGKIFVQDPLPGGSPAVITAAAPVVVLVNGQPVTGPAEVTSLDKIEWSITEPPLYKIHVSEDHLQAFSPCIPRGVTSGS